MTDFDRAEARVRLRLVHAENPFPWRVGTNVAFHIYDANPDGEGGRPGRYVATARTADQAALIVEAVNRLAREAGLSE